MKTERKTEKKLLKFEALVQKTVLKEVNFALEIL
jgi:hypothetical protein